MKKVVIRQSSDETLKRIEIRFFQLLGSGRLRKGKIRY